MSAANWEWTTGVVGVFGTVLAKPDEVACCVIARRLLVRRGQPDSMDRRRLVMTLGNELKPRSRSAAQVADRHVRAEFLRRFWLVQVSVCGGEGSNGVSLVREPLLLPR